MRRKLLENEKIIKKWGQLNLSTHRLWIESGNDDNYFLNSIELHKIQGHSIVKYSNRSLLTLSLASFFMSPLSVLLLKFTSTVLPLELSNSTLNWCFLASGLAFLLFGANFFWRFQTSRSLTLNFQAGPRNIYFRLSGEFARINDALDFSNLVDAEIHCLSIKLEKRPVANAGEKSVSFKIA